MTINVVLMTVGCALFVGGASAIAWQLGTLALGICFIVCALVWEIER